MDWPYKHYTMREWGPDATKVAPALIFCMDWIREEAGVAVHIHCSWESEGHSTKSRHYTTEDRPLADAVDFHFSAGLTPEREVEILEKALEKFAAGCGGLGFYPHWRPRHGYHLDLRPGHPVRWFRDHENNYHYGPEALASAVGRV